MCSLRLACNGRRRNQQTQEWEDVPNYFDVSVWGAQGENCQRYLSKGRGVAVDGRLQWREWTDGDGNKRQAVDIVAENVQFLGGGNGGSGEQLRAVREHRRQPRRRRRLWRALRRGRRHPVLVHHRRGPMTAIGST